MSPRVHRDNCPTSERYVGQGDWNECWCTWLDENDPVTDGVLCE